MPRPTDPPPTPVIAPPSAPHDPLDLIDRVLVHEDRAETMHSRAGRAALAGGIFIAAMISMGFLRMIRPGWAPPTLGSAIIATASAGVLFWILALGFFIRRRAHLSRAAKIVARAQESDLPAEIPPLLGESFAPFRVLACTDASVHLARSIGTNLWIARRFAIGALFVLAIAGAAAAIFAGFQRKSGIPTHSWHIFFLLGGITKLLGPQVVQWVVEKTPAGPRLTIEVVRWVFFRRVIDLAPTDIGRLYSQTTGKVTSVEVTFPAGPVGLAGEESDPATPIATQTLRLLALPGGELGAWRARRIGHLIAQVMSLEVRARGPDKEDDDADE